MSLASIASDFDDVEVEDFVDEQEYQLTCRFASVRQNDEKGGQYEFYTTLDMADPNDPSRTFNAIRQRFVVYPEEQPEGSFWPAKGWSNEAGSTVSEQDYKNRRAREITNLKTFWAVMTGSRPSPQDLENFESLIGASGRCVCRRGRVTNYDPLGEPILRLPNIRSLLHD